MSALQKIASRMTQIPQRDLREVEGMNAFFIVPTNWRQSFGELFLTHPPLEKRLARSPRSRGRWAARFRRSRPMGLGDVLFGRKRLKGPNRDRLFALSTARISLEVELGPEAARRRGRRLQATLRRRVRTASDEMQ